MAMDKWTKIGAVVGGVLGLLAWPTALLCIILGPSAQGSVGGFLFNICSILLDISTLPFRLMVISKIITSPPSTVFVVFAVPFVVWALIGAIIGFLYGLIWGNKR